MLIEYRIIYREFNFNEKKKYYIKENLFIVFY